MLQIGSHSEPAAAPRVMPTRPHVNLAPLGFLALPLAVYAIWMLLPMTQAFLMSLTETDGVFESRWVGLANFRRLAGDQVFWMSLANNVRWLAALTTAPVVLGLGLAVVLNRDLPGVRFIRAAFFAPMVLSTVVIAITWTWLYSRDGLINVSLSALGLANQRIGWLSDPNLVTWAIIGAALWRQVGYVMLLYLAGLKGIDHTLVDASRVDGATNLQSFRDVVLPLLQPVNVVVVVISVIDALRTFDYVNVMTGGGPFNSSNVLTNMMYLEAFNHYAMGYGAAIATVLFVLSLAFIVPYLVYTLKTELEYE